MINVNGIWLPDDEDYLREKLANIPDFAQQYDADTINLVVSLPRRRTAIDVGANVGLWSRRLAQHFERVESFEPLAVARECLRMNVTASNVTVHAVALGEIMGWVAMRTKPTADGRSTTVKCHIATANVDKLMPGAVMMGPLDSYQFDDVDFIKVDCEGFDYFVLKGAEGMINKWQPAIVFEAKPTVSWRRYKTPTDAAARWLQDHGYIVDDLGRGNFFAQHKGLT